MAEAGAPTQPDADGAVDDGPPEEEESAARVRAPSLTSCEVSLRIFEELMQCVLLLLCGRRE